MAAPSTVRSVAVTNLLSGFRFLIEWTLNFDSEGVTAYNVFRSPNQDAGYNLVQTVQSPGTQFVDKVPFTYGAVFYYKVVAVNSAGYSSDITQAPAVTDITFDDFEEKPFRSVDISASSFIYGKTPSGTFDGVNVNFTTAQYFRTGTLSVYVDGQKLQPAFSYSEGADQKSFTLLAAPARPIAPAWPPSTINADTIWVDYIAL